MADAGGQIPEMVYEAGHSPVIVLFLRSESVIIIQLVSIPHTLFSPMMFPFRLPREAIGKVALACVSRERRVA